MFEAPISLLSFIRLFPEKLAAAQFSSLGRVSDKAFTAISLRNAQDVRQVFYLSGFKQSRKTTWQLTALLPDFIDIVGFFTAS